MRIQNKGFSLIEIIVAIAIAGMAFAVLTQTFIYTLEALHGMKNQNHQQPDTRFVRSQVIMEANRDTFEQGGDLETLNMGTVRWEAIVEDTRTVDLFKVQLRMEFNPPDRDRFVEEETLWLLRPTWSDPMDRSSLLDDARRELDNERSLGW